jgi:hypothetical protein
MKKQERIALLMNVVATALADGEYEDAKVAIAALAEELGTWIPPMD